MSRFPLLFMGIEAFALSLQRCPSLVVFFSNACYLEKDLLFRYGKAMRLVIWGRSWNLQRGWIYV